MSDTSTIGAGEIGKDAKPNAIDETKGEKLDAAAATKPDRIGIIFVHGIGEQKRFSHLDNEARPLIDALRRRKAEITVEIAAGNASTLLAEQDTWSTGEGAPVRVIVKEDRKEKHLMFHEVWWADVNEPYSFKKEFRFWMWGLAMWNIPPHKDLRLPGQIMRGADFRKDEATGEKRKGRWFLTRLQLFCASNLFLMGAFSVGALVFLARRLLGYSAPDFVKVFENYLSAVRLYTQNTRAGGGFLDAYLEAPRVSIRRRMVRTIVDVALREDYDRWYIFAHSLGSIVAFNGVMENAQALPNYLDESRWDKLTAARLNGIARPDEHIGHTGNMLPARPLWLATNHVVHREKLFAKFAGLLTYGSPLDKFAMLWPAEVPINVGEKIFFNPDANTKRTPEWINVYDPTDPVAASLEAFDATTGWPGLDTSTGVPSAPGVPTPQNQGYRAGNWLLVSHLRYLTVHRREENNLSDALMTWVLGGRPFSLHEEDQGRWFPPDSWRHTRRTWGRWAWWFVAYAAVTFLATLSLPLLIGIFRGIWDSLSKNGPQIPGAIRSLSNLLNDWFIQPVIVRAFSIYVDAVACFARSLRWILNWLLGWLPLPQSWVDRLVGFLADDTAVLLMVSVALVTLLAGLYGRRYVFENLDKKKHPPASERGRPNATKEPWEP